MNPSVQNPDNLRINHFTKTFTMQENDKGADTYLLRQRRLEAVRYRSSEVWGLRGSEVIWIVTCQFVRAYMNDEW